MAAVIALLGLAAVNAFGAAPSGVTIHYKQSQRLLYGFVVSKDPSRCANGRVVKVFRQKGDKQTRRDAKVMGYARTRPKGEKYRWRLTSPLHPLRAGKYFAYINTRDEGCRSDASRTIRISVPHPDTKITGMTIHHRSHRVRFQYESTGGTRPYTYRCFLDDVKHFCKRHAKSLVNVSPGRHVFKVKTVDARGRRDLSPAKRIFRM